MAKSRISPDYIEWVMSLNANQALREIHKVNEESKKLSRQQNAARQAMVKLEAEGKKGSKEWQNLKRSVKEYGDQIKAMEEAKCTHLLRVPASYPDCHFPRDLSVLFQSEEANKSANWTLPT